MELNFGTILKALRTDKGLNQETLAAGLHVSDGTISLWENNLREPKLSNLITIAKFFDVSIDYLAGLKEY